MLNLVPEEIESYAADQTTPLSPLLQELVATTRERFPDRSQMLTGHLEGSLLRMLTASLGARRALEIGMFTGFSALMMAEALPEDGELITCEIDPDHIAVARRFFDRSPHGGKIRVMQGKALQTLETLDGPFDLVFIDADKKSYVPYYERALDLLSPTGVIAVDNVLWSGRVLDPQDDDSRAIVDFNAHVARDERVTQVVLTVRDGVTLIRRRHG